MSKRRQQMHGKTFGNYPELRDPMWNNKIVAFRKHMKRVAKAAKLAGRHTRSFSEMVSAFNLAFGKAWIQ